MGIFNRLQSVGWNITNYEPLEFHYSTNAPFTASAINTLAYVLNMKSILISLGCPCY